MDLKWTVMITTNEQFRRIAQDAGFVFKGQTFEIDWSGNRDTELYYFYLLMIKEAANLLNQAADQNEQLASSPEIQNIIEKAVLMGAQKQSLKMIDSLIEHFRITN